MTKKITNKIQRKAKTSPNNFTFIEHVKELRHRLFAVAAFLIIFTSIGAFIRESLIAVLLAPAKNQQFIYTTPGGGFDFNFRVCLYFGLACSVPVLVYNLFRYISPLLKQSSAMFFVKTTLFSCFLAVIGVCFGYFISLPSALKFLLHQFGTTQIEALLTISDYMSFVMIYLVGFALLFQIPLVLLFINRITPLKPSKLMKSQRWVFLLSFIAAAILTPTGDVMNMTIMAAPIILMYQVGVLIVWVTNRYYKVDKIEQLRRADAEKQAERSSRDLQLLTPIQKPVRKPAKPMALPSAMANFGQPQFSGINMRRQLIQ